LSGDSRGKPLRRLVAWVSRDAGPIAAVLGLDNFNEYYPSSLKRDRQTTLQQAGVHVVDADLVDDGVLREVFRLCQFTHVLHLAAQVGSNPTRLPTLGQASTVQVGVTAVHGAPPHTRAMGDGAGGGEVCGAEPGELRALQHRGLRHAAGGDSLRSLGDHAATGVRLQFLCVRPQHQGAFLRDGPR
jgi:hypothetical protein